MPACEQQTGHHDDGKQAVCHVDGNECWQRHITLGTGFAQALKH